MLLQFGSGELWGLGPAANATPVKFGTLQSASVEFSTSQKELMGQYIYPVAIANASGKISGKVKMAEISGNLYNSLFFGGTMSVGSTLIASGEAGTVPASTPWTVTVTNAATFVQDLGVRYSASGTAFARVASGPTIGQYSVSGVGVYTFATADASAAVLIDYTYTGAAVGHSVNVANQLQGQAPIFQLWLRNGYNAQFQTVQLYACVAQKLSIATKTSDWTVPEFDFSAFSNAAGYTHQFNFAA